jgi:hypothetical protein
MAITAKFEADFTQFKDAVASADSSLKTLETSAERVGPAILASLTGTEIRQLASEVTELAQEFIHAYAQEEAAVKKLDVALAAQGTATDAVRDQYAALASEFQKTTKYSDDLVIQMEALLVQVGHVMPEQMRGALTAAANLSAGLGIDLQTATMLVAKAFGTGGEHLGKLKALLGDTVPKGADMAQVLDLINAKFGGQAQAQLETYEGRMAALGNQMDDFKEKIGGLLVNALTPLLTAFTALPEAVQTVTLGIVALGVGLAPIAVTIAALTPMLTGLSAALFGAGGLTAALSGVVPYLGPAGIIAVGLGAWIYVLKNLDVFIWAAKAGWTMLVDTFRGAASAITGYAQAAYEGVHTWLVVKFESIVGWVREKIASIIAMFQAMAQAVSLGSIVPDMVDAIGAEFGKLDALMVRPVLRATSQSEGGFAQLSEAAPGGGLAIGGGTGGGGAAVTNHIYVNGTAEEVARKVAAEILRTVKYGTQLQA